MQTNCLPCRHNADQLFTLLTQKDPTADQLFTLLTQKDPNADQLLTLLTQKDLNADRKLTLLAHQQSWGGAGCPASGGSCG